MRVEDPVLAGPTRQKSKADEAEGRSSAANCGWSKKDFQGRRDIVGVAVEAIACAESS